MKKKIVLSLLVLLMAASVFAKPMNSKIGYFDLKWGSTVQDAENAGYELTRTDLETSVKQHIEPIEQYYVKSKDKSVVDLWFTYYLGKFFDVQEITKADTVKKLESRYGKFKDNGIVKVDDKYTDAVLDSKGNVSQKSIIIMFIDASKSELFNDIGNCSSARMFDWDVYKTVSVMGRKQAGIKDDSIVEQLSGLAEKLLQEGKNGSKASYAFVALSTDNGDTLVENYVTDALTEAVFNTGKIKIIERANLEKILSEQKFQAGGLVDENTAKEIGNIAGVDYVCYGTLRDTGNEMTVSARVVDVESGEICAMSRDTIKKDDYIKNNAGKNLSPRGASSSGTKSASTASATSSAATPAKKNVESLWTVRTNRNDFDEITTYTFTLKGTFSDTWCFFGYAKNDVASKSYVRAGIHWGQWETDTDGVYELKSQDGNIISKRFSDGEWSPTSSNSDNFYYTRNTGESARFFMNLFENNDFLTVRHHDQVQRYQTAGFWDALEAAGITKDEIENALANEEF